MSVQHHESTTMASIQRIVPMLSSHEHPKDWDEQRPVSLCRNNLTFIRLLIVKLPNICIENTYSYESQQVICGEYLIIY